MKSSNLHQYHVSEEQMLLYCSDELSGQPKTELEDHLNTCSFCQERLYEMQQMVEHFQVIQSRQVSNAVIRPAHHRVMEEIGHSQTSMAKFPWKKASTWLAMAASLIVSFYIGRVTVQSSAGNGYESLMTAYQMMEYGDVKINTETGNLAITLPKVENQTLTGSIQDAKVQRMAQAVLRYDVRSDVRINVLEMINSDMLMANEDLAQTVMFVLEHDTNPGIRLRAMRLLKRLPVSPELIAVLKRILMKGEIEGIRVQAADYLASKDYETNEAFIKQFARDDEYMRSLVLRAEMPLS